MTLPGFLIIGAQKAGTTTLYRDLLANPAVFFPVDKEPGNLCQDSVLTDAGHEEYTKLFAAAGADQLCGDATTNYSKQLEFPGVPERARSVLGESLKVIYIVRQPILRIISHHHHEVTSRRLSCTIDEAVRRHARFIDNSRYAKQITLWLNILAPEQVLILHFENYTQNRAQTIASVCEFLGIEARTDLVRTDEVYNSSATNPVPPSGLLKAAQHNRWYRNLLRPLLSTSARYKLRAALLPKTAPRPDGPDLDTVRWIVDQLSDDVAQLGAIMGRTEPLWDLQEVLQQYEGKSTVSQPPT